MEKNVLNPNQLLRICKGPKVDQPQGFTPCTWSEFVGILESPYTKNIADTLSMMPDTPENSEKRRQLKNNARAFAFNASSFADNYRTDANAVASGLSMLDIDHLTDPLAYYQQLGGDQAMKDCGVVLAHRSISGSGLHLVHSVHPGETIEQAQARLARNLGIDKYDTACKNVSRSCFAFPMSYVLFIDPEQLKAEAMAQASEVLPVAIASALPVKAEAEGPVIEDAEIIAENVDLLEAERYENIPLPEIAQLILSQLLGYKEPPRVGERNNAYAKMQSYFRYVCGNDPKLMLEMAPDLGLSVEEREKICKSMVKYDYKLMPRQLRRLIDHKLLGKRSRWSNHHRPLPKNMPRLFQLIFKEYPKHLQEQIALAIMPLLGTLATALRYKKDPKHVETPTFYVYISGHLATGKSFIIDLEEELLWPIAADDAKAEAIEREWKAIKDACGNGKAPRRPKLCIRKIQSNFTSAALNERIINANGAHIYFVDDESDDFQMTRTISALMRKLYDSRVVGQTRVGAQSVSGSAVGNASFLMCGTPGARDRMFVNAEDGLVSRYFFCSMPEVHGFNQPKWGSLTEHEQQEIRDIVMRLYRIGLVEPAVETNAADADAADQPDTESTKLIQPSWQEYYIKLPRTEKRIDEWCERMREEIDANPEMLALETFVRRIPDFMRRISMVLYALEGMKETNRALDLMEWYGDYILQNLLDTYGHKYEQVRADQEIGQVEYKRNGKTTDVFEMLTEVFTVQDYISCRTQLGLNATVNNANVTIMRWRAAAKIEDAGKDESGRKRYRKLAVE